MTVSGKRVLALVTDAYGGYGGIAAYNRDVIRSFCEDDRISEVVALPRSIPQALQPLPDKLLFDSAAAKGAAAYLAGTFRHALRGRYDLIYCAHLNLAPVAWTLARLLRVPWALCLYGVEAWSKSPRPAVAAVVGKADYYLPLSQVTLDRFRKLCAVPDSRAAVMPNAIHLEEFAPGPKNPELERRYGLEGRPVVMTFGRLDPSEKAKGFDRMIELMPELKARVPGVAYLICGAGGDRPRLEALVKRHSVENDVVFAGMIEEREKADHYRLADAYVMPSVFEGFGFVFLEAMACGIPVVASDVDGGREAVLLGKLGQVVDPFDKAGLLDASVRALNAPKGIPKGLDHFAFPRFKARLMNALWPTIDGGSPSPPVGVEVQG